MQLHQRVMNIVTHHGETGTVLGLRHYLSKSRIFFTSEKPLGYNFSLQRHVSLMHP